MSKEKGSARERFVEIMEMYHSGTLEGRKQANGLAIAELEKFVYSTMWKKFPSYSDLKEDLFQAGCEGILEGMKKYDPKQGAPTTFFYFYIIEQMAKLVNRGEKKMTAHYASAIAQIKEAQNKFEQMDKDWTITDLCIETGLPVETVRNSMQIANNTNCLSMEDQGFVDANITQTALSPEEEFFKKEEASLLQEVIDEELTELEALVIKNEYGFLPEKLSNIRLSEETGEPVAAIKKARHRANRKLGSSEKLCAWFKNNHNGQEILNSRDIKFVPVKQALDMMDELECIDIAF